MEQSSHPKSGEFVIESTATLRRNSHRLQRKFDANLTQGFDGGNKSFIIKGRGSSVVEQPIRNRQVVGSTPTLGSRISYTSRTSSRTRWAFVTPPPRMRTRPIFKCVARRRPKTSSSTKA